MILDQKVVVHAAPDKVWDFLMDIPAVSACVPGVESFEKVDDDTFLGALKVKVGPIGVKLNGKVIVVERDREILGKLGEFGQAVMRRKADQIVGEFAKNMASTIGTSR